MARGDQLARQWRIIQTLVSSRHGKTVAELVREENCHPRTIYRDLEALQEAGFPIYTERVDGKGIWAVVEEYKHKIPVPFTLTELMALYFSRDLISVFKGTVFYESLEALFLKIKATLPPESLAPIWIRLNKPSTSASSPTRTTNGSGRSSDKSTRLP